MNRPQTWDKPAIALLAILYAVGLAGFLWAPNLFQHLTPINLLCSAAVVFLFNKQWNARFVAFIVAVALAGYGIEWLGVNTGAIFGHYQYQTGLGFRIWGIPPLIGLNWTLLVYSTGIIGHRLNTNPLLQAAFAALLMTMLDVFIEPFAIQYHLWVWDGAVVPAQNYLAWFLIAFIMQIPFQYGNFNKHNTVAEGLYIVQLLFFILLRLLILS
jgi:putative membrane protein